MRSNTQQKEMSMERIDRWVPTEYRPLWVMGQVQWDRARKDERGDTSLLVLAIMAGMFALAAIFVVGVIITKTKSRVNSIPDTDSIPAAGP